jgi:hypothetical protein
MDVAPADLERLGEIPGRKILVGGAALPFYGVSRGTLDIDLEVEVASPEELEKVRNALERAGIPADVTADFEGWGMIPLPEGFHGRLEATRIRDLFVLEPVDYIFSKLRRGTEQDIEDCLAVVRARGIAPDSIRQRMKRLRLPVDPISHWFRRTFEQFMDMIEA